MTEVPHLAIPGNGQTLDERRVDRLRQFLAGFERGDGQPWVDELDAILAARTVVPARPSWAHLVAQQPCIEIWCSGCGVPFDDTADYVRHFESLDDARQALGEGLDLAGEDDADPDWVLVDDDLLCASCRHVRETAVGES